MGDEQLSTFGAAGKLPRVLDAAGQLCYNTPVSVTHDQPIRAGGSI